MTEPDSPFGDDVYAAGVEDAEFLDPLENLTGDDPDEAMDTGYSPPDHQPVATRYGTTELEQEQGESLDQRLTQEVPDVDPDAVSDIEPDPRAGRLVAPDEGAHSDVEATVIASDVGRAGNAASAEEAAMHIVDEDVALALGDPEDDELLAPEPE